MSQLKDPIKEQPITEREREVIRLLGAGYSKAEVAEMLGVKKGTIESCRRKIFVKLQFTERMDIVKYAKEAGIVKPADMRPGGPARPGRRPRSLVKSDFKG